MKVKVTKDFISLPSMGKEKLRAEVVGAKKAEDKKLTWRADFGIIDEDGNYTAPKASRQDRPDTVTVASEKNPTDTDIIRINVEAELDYREFISHVEVVPIGKNGLWSLEVQCTNHYGFGNKCSIVVTEYDTDLESILPDECDIPPDEDGNPPIARWTVHMVRVKSSSKGYVSIPLKKFEESVRTLHIRVKGTQHDRVITLRGPKPKFKFDINAGFWANATQKF